MEQQNKTRQPGRQSSSRTGKSRRGKRRRIRYDRIVIALAIVVVLLVLMCSCTCSCVQCVCGPSKPEEATNSTASSSGSTDTTSESDAVNITTAPAQNAVSMTLSGVDMQKGTLSVVNESHEYRFPAGDVSLISVYEKRNNSYSVSDMGILLDEEVVEHLNMFLSEFSTIYGKNDIQVTSGYRSKQDQQSRYSSGSSIFPGGYSDYHTARSFDLCIAPNDGMSSYYVPSGDYTWIAEHADEYGFVVRYPDGKIDSTGVNPRSYTFHYVGVPHSVYMYEHDLCLEEYVELVRDYPATAPLTVKTEDGEWTVFYVAMSTSGSTVINIPSCQEYTVSGDNIGGFIVAYH